MINRMMLLMSLLGRLLERPALPRAKYWAPRSGVFKRFRSPSLFYSAHGGAEDCD
jgi:hypothetical protein